ncbi:RAMP superfamily CRISPR-associated protein [Saccharolobus islandicus]|uniref:RAMP superfamily CRISPR-associated protein n=1 Tax=Saccharolobus islandicus TaxID=43080 RepID=UPI00036EB754|nr:RAMP superfamily CRISPR-associated protein [Sulfolobus islandicus]
MDVFDIVNQLVDRRKVEFTFINSTPWWGGNEFGYTFDDEGNVTIPSANTIVGKTRWLMRNIIAQILGLNSFDEIDEKYFKDLGTLNAKSKITVKVIKEEGEVQPPYYFSKKEAACVFKIIKSLDTRNWLGKCLQLNRPPHEQVNDLIPRHLRNYWNSLNNDIRSFFRYFLIPRFVLVTMGENDPLFYYHIQPAKPKSVKIKVEVINNGADEDFFNFFISSLVFTMKYMGIGKAATRGFGRFILINKPNKHLEEDLEELIRLGLIIAKRYHGEKAYDLSFCRSVEKIDNPCVFFYKDVVWLPIYGNDLITYLIAIGNATLKVAWKAAIKGSYRIPGATYHTWTLGLPRSGKDTGYFIDNEDKGRRISYITISPICDGERCYEIYLIPFVYEDINLRKLKHNNNKRRAINRIRVETFENNCNLTTNNSMNNVKAYINVTLSWLKFILSGGKQC